MSDSGMVTAPEGTAAEVAEAFAAESPLDSRSRTLVWQDPVPTAAAGATMTGMEYMTAVVTGEVPPPPIAVTMRLRPVELEEGRVVFEGEPGEEHYNPIGVVHGGYAAT
ncbi:MAG TPA: aromatic compound degradation protein PaaI, partial [Solirubrobacterales bacterium]